MIKTIWNWLTWKLFQGSLSHFLDDTNKLVRHMDDRDKLPYAIKACEIGFTLWDSRFPEHSFKVSEYMDNIYSYMYHSGNLGKHAKKIKKQSKYFQGVATGLSHDKLLLQKHPDMIAMELGSAFGILSLMMELVYPNQGFEPEINSRERCSDSEGLSRMAVFIVHSIAVAYGHEFGISGYKKVYSEIIKGAKFDWDAFEAKVRKIRREG